jgi:predicted N-acetyltransferase YhbS
MQTTEIVLAGLKPEHLDGAVALSRQAGWPHRREDWAMALSLSIGVVAIEEGRVVGTAMTTPYGQAAATINMVIVDEALRGRGVGKKLMTLALKASEGRETRLVATEDGLPLYEKLGFRATGTILQHQGMPVPTLPNPDSCVGWAEPANTRDLSAMDRQACGMDRSTLIGWLARHARIAVFRQEGEVQGFAALRTFGKGEVVGPIVARDGAQAKALLAFVFSERQGAFLRVDTPERAGISPWLSQHGLVQAGDGVAMTRDGTIASTAQEFHTFALASQAFG